MHNARDVGSYNAALTVCRENILEKMIDISRHVILRLRMVETLEHIATTISDPLLQIHTDGLSDSTHTTLRVTIISNNYDLIK